MGGQKLPGYGGGATDVMEVERRERERDRERQR